MFKQKKIIFIVLFLIISSFFIFIYFHNFLKTRAQSADITFKIKLQGDYSQNKNPTIKSKVTIYTLSEKVKEFSDLALTQDNNENFNIKIPLAGLDLSKLYAVFIKPERYLGRVFCSQTISGSSCTAPQFILSGSQNAVDLSANIFFSGDINPADGKVDSYDLSKIISNLGKNSGLSPDTDLNYNGITNTQDYAMALYSLSQNAADDQFKLSNPTPTTAPTKNPSANPTPTAKPPTPKPTKKPKPTKTPTPKPTTKPTSGPNPSTNPTPTSSVSVTPSITNVPGTCSTMDNGLPNSTMHYPNGSTALPQTTKEICATNASSYYSLPYRNPNCLATENGIKKAYERMKTYYPSYWQGSKLLTDWQNVQKYAKQYNFNPLFVIAVWIEESAAGGAGGAQQLGCLYRLNKDDTYTFLSASSSICEQMECFFGRRSVIPENYGLWACQYQFGGGKWQDNHCLEAVNFADGIEFWYNYAAENLSADCHIKYYSGADPRCGQ